jgi:hypothetical protein
MRTRNCSNGLPDARQSMPEPIGSSWTVSGMSLGCLRAFDLLRAPRDE